MSELAVVHYGYFGHMFCDRTQRVQSDGIKSDFYSLLCGVLQGSVLGPIKFCLSLLPFHRNVKILWYH